MWEWRRAGREVKCGSGGEQGVLQQETQAVHERVQVPPHVVAAEEEGEEALHDGVEQLELHVTRRADKEEGRDDFVQALAVRHAAALAVPAEWRQQNGGGRRRQGRGTV